MRSKSYFAQQSKRPSTASGSPAPLQRGRLGGLFDGDGLREIARLVHIAAARNCSIVGKQLQRDDGEDRHDEFIRRRHMHDMIDVFLKLYIAFRGNADNDSVARLDLLDIGERLFIDITLRRKCNDGRPM